MVQKFTTKYGHIQNVTVKVGNIENAEFAESFDAVICFGVFPHVDHKEKALQNIYSILKPSGNIVIAHALSSEELKHHHNSASSHVANDVLPKEAKMIQLLEQTGFVEIRIKDEPRCYLCVAHKPSKP
jgi:2-polyprenyl-3-methyl-5-hydroxy-6-metoxy-1,4-benzoquinol methylase